MYSIVPLVGLLVILNGMLSSVSGLPAQQFGTVLNSIVPSSEPLGTCYEVDPEGYVDIGRSLVVEFAVDSQGRQCYEPVERRIQLLFDRTQLEKNYANVTAEFCPTWPRSKQCLLDHLNSDKCNDANRKGAKDSVSLSLDVVGAELLCNPRRPDYLLYLLKSTSEEGLWSCFAQKEVREFTRECGELYENNGNFAALSSFFECLKPGIRKCAGGDAIKEEKLVSLWDEFDGALQDSFTKFWSQLNR